MFKKGNKSQIATVIVFCIAVIFLFGLFSINMGMVARKKTQMDNIVDSVGLSLASQFASMGTNLKQQMELYGYDVQKCDPNWDLIIGIGLIIGAAVAAILSFGTSIPFSTGIAIAGIGMAIGGGVFGTQGAAEQFAGTNPGALQSLQLKFQGLSLLQQMIETPIEGSLFPVVDDPGKVTDTQDMDRDNDTTDQIPRFLKWYIIRLNSFPRVGNQVRDFISPTASSYHSTSSNITLPYTFFKDSHGQQRFFFQINPDDLLVSPDDPAIEGNETSHWMIDGNGDNIRELWIAQWFRHEFPQLLTELRKYGYGINVVEDAEGHILNISDSPPPVTKPYETDAVNVLINEIEQFETLCVRSLRNIDYDTAVQGLDAWLPTLAADWWNRLDTLRTKVTELRDRLNIRIGQIHTCVSNCSRRGLSCKSTYAIGAPPCHSHTSTYCDGWDSFGNCNHWGTVITIDGWTGCDGPGGTLRSCGTACGSATCPPTYICNTPLPDQHGIATSPCCEIAPMLEPNCRQANQKLRGNILNTYHGYDTIRILDNFLKDITEVENVMGTFYADIQLIASTFYTNTHEAFYVWRDYLGGSTGTKQDLLHIVYVNITGNDPTTGFKVPHFGTPSQGWQWYGGLIPYPVVCAGVADAVGTFRLTIARFDENSRDTGPLSKFWRFVFSRGSPDIIELGALASVVTQYTAGINHIPYPQYYNINASTGNSPFLKGQLLKILRDHGIGTRAEFSYGPGYTYDPKDQATCCWPGDPAKRNRDIHIVSTTSRWWIP